MRIYDGSPRQDFEEVFRSIGAFLDARGMRDILLLEVPDGFVVQGLVMAGGSASAWSETIGTETKETLTFVDDDIAKFMEEAALRRGVDEVPTTADVGHERALRVIGRWMDVAGQAGSHHELAEFTREDIANLVSQGPTLRDRRDTPAS